MVRYIIQYIRWKLRKAIGKTTLEYLSISEAFIPNSLSGGGPTGAGGGAGEQPKEKLIRPTLLII